MCYEPADEGDGEHGWKEIESYKSHELEYNCCIKFGNCIHWMFDRMRTKPFIESLFCISPGYKYHQLHLERTHTHTHTHTQQFRQWHTLRERENEAESNRIALLKNSQDLCYLIYGAKTIECFMQFIARNLFIIFSVLSSAFISV